jgi:hypothetical protein
MTSALITDCPVATDDTPQRTGQSTVGDRGHPLPPGSSHFSLIDHGVNGCHIPYCSRWPPILRVPPMSGPRDLTALRPSGSVDLAATAAGGGRITGISTRTGCSDRQLRVGQRSYA